MTRYRRMAVGGGTYFLTVVTYRRQRFLTDEEPRRWLRGDRGDAGGLAVPDRCLGAAAGPSALHLDPAGRGFGLFDTLGLDHQSTKQAKGLLSREDWLTDSKRRHREGTVWQRRFWEHVIRDERDYRAHMDHIHYNPVKHGLVSRAVDWPFSSFHRYAKAGAYASDWVVAEHPPDFVALGE